MSFAAEVKLEIAENLVTNPCCAMAACYGAACFAKRFDTRGLLLRTEQEFVAQWAKRAFGFIGVDSIVIRREGGGCDFAVEAPYEVEKMLAMLGHSGEETSLVIHRDNLLCEGCFSAFTAAAFLCGGTMVDPDGGYGLEFISPRYRMIEGFAAIQEEHEFAPKITRRNGVNVIYFRASEQIEDLLTTMGAPKMALEIMSRKVYKDFRNRANRITNCETANIDKTILANRENLLAIEALERAGALETLPQPLLETALLRRDNPDLSLAELAELFPQPVSKSGLSHRFKKLRERAQALQTNQKKA